MIVARQRAVYGPRRPACRADRPGPAENTERMDPNAHRSGGRRPGADAYWQRRFFTLLAGLAVIGLLAWAASGMASGGSSAHGSGQQSAAAFSTPTTPATSPAPVSATPSAS